MFTPNPVRIVAAPSPKYASASRLTCGDTALGYLYASQANLPAEAKASNAKLV